ncbi:MAG: hypothetical protein R3E72_02335 [Steroidobacteraceae bacterium]
MIHVALIAIALLGSVYFATRTRRVDAYTVAWYGGILYFLPGVVGYTLSPVTPDSPIKLPIALVPEASVVMLAVLLALLVTGAIYDELVSRWPSKQPTMAGCEIAAEIALLLALLGLILTYIESGGAAFAADKRVVIEVVGRGHLLWQMGASVSAVLAFVHRRKRTGTLAWLLLLGDMLIGFRYAFALSMVAVALLWASRLGEVRLISLPKKYVVTVLAAGLLVISYQNLKEPVRNGDWSEIGRRISSPLWYGKGILTSEPFTTQTVLNEIVRRDFRTRTDHVQSAAQHFLLFSRELGAETDRFGDLYQPALFPRVDHGLGNNIWAQMWSAGGWPLLGVFILLFATAMGLGSRLLLIRDPTISALVALSIAYAGFYLHRNELLVEVGYLKQVFLVWTLSVVGGWVLALVVTTLLEPSERPRR